MHPDKIVIAATIIDIFHPRSIVIEVLIANQMILTDNECAVTGHSKAAVLAVTVKVAVVGLPAHAILWLDGQQRERK